MWAPADLFSPTVNAIALALKRGTTFAWNHSPLLLIIVAVLIAMMIVIGQFRRKSG